MNSRNKYLWSFLALFLITAVSLTTDALGDSVHSCKVIDRKLKNDEVVAVTRCIVEISGGRLGDVVEIKNQYNYIVATGKIVKTRGRYALVIVTDITREIKTGYPVIVRNNDSIDYWTATKSPY